MNSVSPATYTYQRLVRYGDCDASSNYFTPRAVDYAVEAVEGWCENVLGVSWTGLISQRDLEVHFEHVGCEFRKTVTAGDVVTLRVRAASTDNSRIVFNVSGDNDAGEPCFLAALTACFVTRRQRESISIPPEFQELIDSYQACCGADAATAKDTGHNENDGSRLPFQLTPGSRDEPFVHQRRVAYGECNPSGTVYPPRVFDYLLEAVGEWYEKYLGISWLEQNIRKIGQPFLNVTCDYLSPIVPGQLIYTMVTVSRLGRSSIAYSAEGFDGNGVRCFDGKLTACYCIEEDGALKATPFPEEMRGRITAYQAVCDTFTCTKSSEV
ncbi:MAG: thioesterase family protein [Desulfuromonadaceae bacterium]